MNDLRIVADQQIKNGFLFIKFIMDPELLTPENVAQFTRLASSIITQFHYGGEDGVEIRMPLEVLEKYGPERASRAKIIVQMANIANSLGASFNPIILKKLQSSMKGILDSAKAVKEFKNEIDDTLIDRITNLLTAREHDVSKAEIRDFLADESSTCVYGETGTKFKPIRLSKRNKLLAYYQWIKAGRKGFPTNLLTQLQWRIYGGMVLNTNHHKITPIILIRSDNQSFETRDNLIKKSGLTPDEINGINKTTIENLYHKLDFDGPTLDFYPEPFFDISDMKREDIKDKTFNNQASMSNVQGAETNKFKKMDIGAIEPNAAIRRKNFAAYVNQNHSIYLDKALSTIKRGDITPYRLDAKTLGLIIAKQELERQKMDASKIESYAPICYDIAMNQTRLNNDNLKDIPDDDKEAMYNTILKLVRVSKGLMENKEKEKIIETFNKILSGIEKAEKNKWKPIFD